MALIPGMSTSPSNTLTQLKKQILQQQPQPTQQQPDPTIQRQPAPTQTTQPSVTQATPSPVTSKSFQGVPLQPSQPTQPVAIPPAAPPAYVQTQPTQGSTIQPTVGGQPIGGGPNTQRRNGIAVPLYSVEGYDPNKFYDPGHQTTKYQVLRIVAQYPNTQAGFDAAAQELAVLGFTVVDRDSGVVYRPDVGLIDVHRALSSGGGGAWQWMPVGSGTGGGAGGPGGGPGGGGNPFGGGGAVSPLPPGPIDPTLPGDPNPYPPNSDLGGTTPVGQDELSQSITAQLLNLLSGGGMLDTPLNQALGQNVLQTIQSGGVRPGDDQELAMRLENARSPLDRLRQAQLSEAQAALAARGQLVPNFQGQGPEAAALTRIEERLAPEYAAAGRDIALGMMQQQEERLTTALGLATGLSLQQTQNLLNTIGTGTQRQQILSDIALQTLDRNMQWNMFLANFGLNRDAVMNEIRTGNLAAILPILTTFMQATGISVGGYVG